MTISAQVESSIRLRKLTQVNAASNGSSRGCEADRGERDEVDVNLGARRRETSASGMAQQFSASKTTFMAK